MAYDKKKKRRRPPKKDGDDKSDVKKGQASKRSDSSGNHPYASDGHNDPSWYTKSGPLAVYAGKVSWAYPTGAKLFADPPRLWSSNIPLSQDYADKRVNGIMTLDLAIVPGCDVDAAQMTSTNPANMAARDIYSYLRSTNSGAKNYEPADIILYVMALDSIFSMYAWGLRAYGSVALSSAYNQYYPKAIVEAQKFRYDTIRNNMSNIRNRMNLIAQRMSRFKVPIGLSIIDRHFMLYSNMYLDNGEDIRSQIYMYNPVVFYEYDGTTAGATMKPIWVDELDPTNPNFVDFDMYLRKLEDVVERFTTMEHTPIINGDMIKAYGDGPTYVLPPVLDGYICLPGYNIDVLYQMRNAIVAGEPVKDTWNITQSDGLLTFTPVFNCVNGLIPSGVQLVSSPKMLPSDEETIVYTRLMTTFRKYGNETTQNQMEPNSLGADVCTSARIWSLTDALGGSYYKFYHTMWLSNYAGATALLRNLSSISNFKHHPRISLVTNDGYLGEFWEYDSYAQVSEEQLNNLNYNAMVSLWAIPEIGAWDKK